jgi:DNA-binding LacI/PurR family transcriptional regulator
VLAWPEGSRVGDDRLAGYQAAMQAAGLPVAPEWVARGEGSFEFGLAATQRWLDLAPAARPTAVVALSDTAAVGALHALHSRGLTPPHDLALVGFDDAPLAQFMTPPLSSIRQPLREAGRQCVEILVGGMEDKPVAATQVLLAPSLIVRATS